MLVGFVASGNLCRVDGRKVSKAPPSRAYLELIFNHEPFPEGKGFYFSEKPLTETDNGFTVLFLEVPEGQPESGSIMGVGIQLLSLAFVVAVHKSNDASGYLYRPQGFVLGGKGEIRLSWKNALPTEKVRLPLA